MQNSIQRVQGSRRCLYVHVIFASVSAGLAFDMAHTGTEVMYGLVILPDKG